jgi:hypothetical protein
MIAILLLPNDLEALEKGKPERGMGGVLSTIGYSVQIILFEIGRRKVWGDAESF